MRDLGQPAGPFDTQPSVLRKTGTNRGVRLSSSRVVATVHDRLISPELSERREPTASPEWRSGSVGERDVINRYLRGNPYPRGGGERGGEGLTCISFADDL